MSKVIIKEMMDNIVHIGNKSSFWSPKMREYIYGASNGVHIFNLNKTLTKLDEVTAELAELTKSGKTVLFVSTKIQSRETVSTMAESLSQPYVSEKWVPGLLTNFRTIKKRIATYTKLLKDKEVGGLDMLTKKEQAAKLLELEKLDKAYKGLKNMNKLPDAVFVCDGKFEEQAVREANRLNIPVYGLLNTNGDIDNVVNFVPSNTNSFRSVKFIINYISKSLTARKVAGGAPKKGGITNKMVQRSDKSEA